MFTTNNGKSWADTDQLQLQSLKAGTVARLISGQRFAILTTDEGNGLPLANANFANPFATPTKNFDTLALAVASSVIIEGDVIDLKERTSGNGGSGTWDAVSSSTVTENTFDVVQCVGSPLLSLVLRNNGVIGAKQIGAIGSGLVDDAPALQAAITRLNADGVGTLLLSEGGDFRVSKTTGINDKWGININFSNISLKSEDGSSLRRLDPDISTFVKSFPIVLVGVPDDDNESSQITGVTIEGVYFIGEDVRHTSSGSALMDGRQAIWLKNIKGCKIIKNTFTLIDSSSIWTQRPAEVNHESATFYNTTKCYDISINNNNFVAVEHAVPGRALLHAINIRVDQAVIEDNIFEWCDDCIACSTTYDDYNEKETDTYIDPNVGAVKRVGKGLIINANTMYNSSEHCVYLNGMAISCSANVITVDDNTICNTAQIQIRGRGVTVSGNTLTGVSTAINVNVGSIDVLVSSNSIQSFGDSPGGIINITSAGLTAFISNRSAFFQSFKPMKNISIMDNAIEMPDSAQTDGVGIRILTDTSDVNFPDGQMVNVNINANTISGARKCILTIAPMLVNCRIANNIFNGKSFIQAGFNGSTVMNSEYVLGIDDSFTLSLMVISFDNNTIFGFENVLFDDGGGGGAGTINLPQGMRSNRLSFIQNFSTSAFTKPVFQTQFTNNTGSFVLDRTQWFGNTALQNSLSDGTSNSEKKSMFQIVSITDVRAYADDAGGFKPL